MFLRVMDMKYSLYSKKIIMSMETQHVSVRQREREHHSDSDGRMTVGCRALLAQHQS